MKKIQKIKKNRVNNEILKKKIPIPLWDGLRASLRSFERLSLLECLNPSFLSKVMAI